MRWRLVDRITRFEPWRAIAGVKTVSFEEYCLLEPLGLRGALPQSMVVGCFCELAGWLAAASTGFESSCLLTGVESFSLEGAGMGSALELGMEVVRKEGETLAVSCTLADRGERAGGGGLVFEIVPLRELYDAGGREILWRELYVEA